jgi:hypothetical protein
VFTIILSVHKSNVAGAVKIAFGLQYEKISSNILDCISSRVDKNHVVVACIAFNAFGTAFF